MPPRKGVSRKTATRSQRGDSSADEAPQRPAGRAPTRSLRSKASTASVKDDSTAQTQSADAGMGSRTPPPMSQERQLAEEPPSAKLIASNQPTTPSHSALGNGKAAASTTRQIFTPVFGRKYARGQIDVPFTPKRGQAQGTPLDPMRIAVSKTPYTAKRAIADYEAEKDPIKTYVRLKPADAAMFSGALPKSLLQVVSDKEVEMARGFSDDSLCERYLFAGVLPSLAKQPRVFEVCAMPVVKDLFAGYNTLLFTYGITNSGKTYTMQGNSSNPGVLPRSVKAVLDLLDTKDLHGEFPIRPKYATQVEYCSDPRVVSPTFRIAPGEDAWIAGLEMDGSAADDPTLTEVIRELEESDSEGEWVYQLYVSYFEVYNEMIYDLLDLTTLTTVHVKPSEMEDGGGAAGTAGGAWGTGRGRGKARKPAAGRGRKRAGHLFTDDPNDPLHMSSSQIAALQRNALLLRSEGGRGNEAFVDGVTEVRVRNIRDLVRVLIHGQMRRAVHATGLNLGSSRSHALFQAKLVKIRRSTEVVPLSAIPLDAQPSVRTMTIVDLAGSERAKRTLNQGDRLAEAGKINVSLMTLKKCLDVKRYNASLDPLANNEAGAQLVPYNESKVTRLFQPALEGGAKTIMVVCIDPYEHTSSDTSDPRRMSAVGPTQSFIETKNVLDFARVASSIVTRVRRVEDPELPLLSVKATRTLSGRSQESPSRTGIKSRQSRGLPVDCASTGTEDDEEDEEDEIFFDIDGQHPHPRRGTAKGSRKRKSSVLDADDKTKTDEEVFDTPAPPVSETLTKRQRNDLGGNWQRPSSRPPVNQAIVSKATAASSSRTPVAKAQALSQQTHMDAVSPSVWKTIASNSPFSFELPPERVQREAPLLLSRTFLMNNEHKRDISVLRDSLNEANAKLKVITAEKETEVEELVTYADALETAINELKEKYAASQERVLRIEEETRAEVSSFFIEKISQIKDNASERLHEELERSEIKSAHKIDILSRLRTIRSMDDSDEEADGMGIDAAQVPTVSPRTAVRRAVSRAASKRANKLTSVSAGENKEMINLRNMIESLEAQISSQNTQLEMINQARNADRASREALESALVEAGGRAATLEARLMRMSSVHSAEAELAITRAHERERAEFLAQITMLKTQLRDAETHSMRARRQWETQELLPVQERLRIMVNSASLQTANAAGDNVDVAEMLERSERDRDNAWSWWTREQERNSQLCAQNDVLMREIRHLRGQLKESHMPVRSGSPQLSIHTESISASDEESFCKVSLRSVDSLSAINGGNQMALSTVAVNPSQASFGGGKPMNALDRVVAKGRVLHRNPTAKNFSPGRESTESFAASSTKLSPPIGISNQGKQGGRAKRVVSRMFNHFAPDSRRRGDPSKPYMAGRFANTDTAVGSYSAEVFSFDGGVQRPRGNTMESADSSLDPRQARLRSIVYSGPIVAHSTGGVSVTFTSEQVHDLPLGAEGIPEQPEEEEEEEQNRSGSNTSPSNKRTRSMVRKPGTSIVHSREQPETIAEETSEGEGEGEGEGKDEGHGMDEHDQHAGSSGDSRSGLDIYEDEHMQPDNAGSAPNSFPVRSSSRNLTGNSAAAHSMPSSSLDQSQEIGGLTSVADMQSTIKKKRKLHAGRTVLSIGSPDGETEDDRLVGAPSARNVTPTPDSVIGSWPPVSSPTYTPVQSSKNHSKVAKAALPQESKQPVLFTPVRTRTRSKVGESSDMLSGSHLVEDQAQEERSESIFLTPMKMLNRLRNRKK